MQNSKITFGQYLMKVNKYSKEKAAETNKDRTYIRLFRPYNTNKLNIIGSFEEAITKEKNKCNHFNPNSQKSFGIISKEQFSNYCFLYSKNRYIYQNKETFQKYINQNYKNFVIDDEELTLAIKKIKELKDKKLNILISNKETKKIKEIIQKSLYARCLLSVFYECAITIQGSNAILKDINNIIQTNKNIIVTLKNNILIIKGTLDNNTLKEIDKKYLFVKEKNNNLTVYNKTNNNQKTSVIEKIS